jgi:hypothetical protein
VQRSLRILVIVLPFVVLLAVAGSSAAEAPPADRWEFRATPYLWLPAMTGNATIEGTTADIDTTIADIFTEDDFAFALQGEGEAWYEGRWGLLFSGQWSILKQNNNAAGTPLSNDLNMNLGIFEFAAAYSFGEPTSWARGRPWSSGPARSTRTTRTIPTSAGTSRSTDRSSV